MDVTEREMNCPNPAKSEAALKALGLLENHGPIVPTDDQLNNLQSFVKAYLYKGWCQDQFRETGIRLTGPILPAKSRTDDTVTNTAFSTHARVKVYYSESVVTWLKNDRQGIIPDGGTIVKAMWWGLGDETADSEIDGWAVMVRDSKASRDGWLWYLYYKPGNKPYTLEYESGQYGLSFCLACHASATEEYTFASLNNLTNTDVATFVNLKDPGVQTLARGGGAHDILGEVPPDVAGDPFGGSEKEILAFLSFSALHRPHDEPKDAFVKLFEKVIDDAAKIAAEKPRPLPMDVMFDHVPPAPDRQDSHFITASACTGCHDVADLLNGTNPEMSVAVNGHKFDRLPLMGDTDPPLADLSPYGEWSGSLMSVSASDPVFRAQLESEVAKYPAVAAETTKLCMSCHAPMGYRSDEDLAGNIANTYSVPNDNQDNPREARFGALARDGVSCAVCHHIADENLGEPASFTAHFTLGPADEFYGPFDNVKTKPMVQALGVTPVQGTHIQDSGLCGTCHMVDVPVLDNPEILLAHEQTTYYEWRNSAFEKPTDFRSCQDCHMPNTNPMDPDRALVDSKIANIEDTNFPYTPHRLSSDELDTVPREGYGRHTLTGINLFTMAMFQQFPLVLGSNTFYPARPYLTIAPPKSFAMEEAKNLAAEETARIELTNVTTSADGYLEFTVSVENLAGHKFPTGVGFRRAYLEVSVLDENGETVWCSGCTDDTGVILDGPNGNPLPSEFPVNNEYQPYYPAIAKQSQVQIYETRHKNADDILTTSFLELDKEVKDTRLLPKGWDTNGYPDYDMNPVGRDIPEPAHIDVVQFNPEGVKPPAGGTVRARIYYQALPPYYLLDRVALLNDYHKPGDFPETQRLLHIVSMLDLETESSAHAIEGWKLLVGQEATAAVAY
ncbi:MAG: cytochrome P460 family protein [Gammaproteobacteria bacterium]|nr:cytochrome P460 family protein [Gammaproteobacteria bacterium]